MLISMSEARANWYKVVRCAEAGEDIILTLRGKPVVRLASMSGPAAVAAETAQPRD